MSIWEGFCTLCVCGPCNLSPRYSLSVVSLLSFFVGVGWFGLGIWLLVITLLNAALPFEQQIFFEKLNIVDTKRIYFDNESSFIFTPLENLKFYLFAISFIAMLGGLGRGVVSICLIHYVKKKVLPYMVSWLWVVLSVLAVGSLALIAMDTLYTLSHNDVAPPHNREFFFKNDTFHFYTFCHVVKYGIVVDFFLTCYFQWVVRWAQRSPHFNTHHNTNE